jgi:hypothetical protein
MKINLKTKTDLDPEDRSWSYERQKSVIEEEILKSWIRDFFMNFSDHYHSRHAYIQSWLLYHWEQSKTVEADLWESQDRRHADRPFIWSKKVDKYKRYENAQKRDQHE